MNLLYFKNSYFREDAHSFLPVRAVRDGIVSGAIDVVKTGLDLGEHMLKIVDTALQKSYKALDTTFHAGGKLYDVIYDRMYKDPLAHPECPPTSDIDPLNPGSEGKDIAKAVGVITGWRTKYIEDLTPINLTYNLLGKIRDKVEPMNSKRRRDIEVKEEFIKSKQKELDTERALNFNKNARVRVAVEELSRLGTEYEKRLIWREELRAKNLDLTQIENDMRGLIKNAEITRAKLDEWSKDKDVIKTNEIEKDIIDTTQEVKTLRDRKISFNSPELGGNEEDGIGFVFVRELIKLGYLDISDMNEVLTTEMPMDEFFDMLNSNFGELEKRKKFLENQVDACTNKINFLKQKTIDVPAQSGS